MHLAVHAAAEIWYSAFVEIRHFISSPLLATVHLTSANRLPVFLLFLPALRKEFTRSDKLYSNTSGSATMRQTEHYVFFFGREDIYSNWYEAPFEFHGVRFNCVEQFMMYSKAMLFGDQEVAQRILATTDPKSQKALGRAVKNFDQATWNSKCVSIVAVACREKFFQNRRLLRALLDTGTRELVEASPYDKVWGIGLSATSPDAENPEKWPGQNLLGKALMADFTP